jgi:membrane protease YdiL (CAAX protease family)
MRASLSETVRHELSAVGSYLNYVAAAAQRRSIQVFAGVFGVALLILLVAGRLDLVLAGILNVVGFSIFALLTRSVSAHMPAPPLAAAPKRHPAILWIQLAITALLVLLAGHDLLVSSELMPASLTSIPLWTPTVNYLAQLHVPIGNGSLVVPALTLSLPALLLPLLGAGWGELGFETGYRKWYQATLWCSAPVVVFVLGIALASPLIALQRILYNTLAHGPFEEFLFRGVLLTRIMRLFGGAWALVISSLVFALWHVGQTTWVTGNIVVGIAAAIVSYGIFGLALGTLFLRTRNLLAPSLLHVVGLAAFS